MKIGLISDTHSAGSGKDLPSQVLHAFEGVDLILHCGDLECLGVLDVLESVAPVLAVRGYEDPIEPGERLARTTRVVQAEDVAIGMIHDIQWPSPHVGTGAKFKAFFKDRGLDVANVLAGALTVKDDVMKSFLRETELYDEDQYIADRMRRPLEDALRAAWKKKCEVALVSHSMGTFISYDVLWRFSHRNMAGFREFRKNRVRMFVTMGSPLGGSAVREMLFARRHRTHGRRQFPVNIDLWHNYAALGDVVSHQHNFEKVFFREMYRLKLIPRRPRHRAIDYTQLYNPFLVVSHSGNRGREKRNPHKSYGYLVQPRLGTWIADFLRGRLK